MPCEYGVCVYEHNICQKVVCTPIEDIKSFMNTIYISTIYTHFIKGYKVIREYEICQQGTCTLLLSIKYFLNTNYINKEFALFTGTCTLLLRIK